jgi:hypothetical protein
MKSKASAPACIIRVVAALLFSSAAIFANAASTASAASAASAAATERLYITEIMSANTRTLLDRDREYSDWIEIYNAGADPIHLNGWSLTDDPAKLDQWRFPAVTIGPSEFAIIFASGKNRRTPGAELHTNFKLSAEGEYLALVKPDGKTIAMEFAPRFPRQAADASFGVSMGNPTSVLLGEDATKRVLVPARDIGLNWLTPAFDDSQWSVAKKGIGFDARGAYNSLIGLDLASRMAGQAASAYVRIPLALTNAGIESMKLRVRYDDGFIAYLNGWEVARANAPAKATWNSAATTNHGSAVPLSQVERFDTGAGRYWTQQLNPNTKPREHPRVPGTPDRYLRLINGQMANQVNSVAFPSPGTVESDSAVIDLDYRFAGTGEGTERLSILLLPIATHGAEGPGVRLDNLRDPNLPGVFAVQLLHNPENGENALAVHWDGSRRGTLSVPTAPFRPRSFHHARISLEKTADGVLARTVLTADGGGQTATSTVTLPGMKIGAQRLQLGGRIGNWDQTIDVDNVQFQSAGAAGLIGEEFDLTPHLAALKDGVNILGFQALNASKTDSNFFLLPELLAGTSAVRPATRLHLLEPTPGAVNRSGHPTTAPPPVFLTRGGVFKDSVRVEMTSQSGVVRYTLDGSEPSATAAEYTQPFVLNRSVVIKARTFQKDQAPSPTVIETFTIAENGPASFNSNLPLVIINSFGRYINANNKSPVSIRFINTRNGRASLTGPADFDGRASVNLRGYSTLRQPKNSLTVRLKDENADNVKASLFGLPKESDWVLYAPYSDKTLLRDALAYEISNGMGRYAPRTKFVEVYIDRNGGRLTDSDYAGVYVLIERIGIAKNRVDIEPLKPEDIQEPAISGGYLFKRDHSDRYEPSFRTSQGSRFFYVDPKGNEITREQTAWISRYVSQFEQSLHSPEFRNPDRGYARYLDVDAFIDQHWLIEATKNIDGFRYSAFIYKPRNGKLTVGPAWDWNLSFGNADYHDGYDPKGWYTDLLRDSEICWFRRLSEDPEFMQRTIDRWAELRRTVFSRTRIHQRIDEMAAQLNEAQARNFRRWPILGRRVNPNYHVGDTYEEEITWMKSWIAKRIDWIDSQFPRPPALRAGSGGVITISGSGQVHYTLDGSDPRAPGGKPSRTAQLYKGPVTVGKAQVLRARTQRGEQWSGVASSQDKPE